MDYAKIKYMEEYAFSSWNPNSPGTTCRRGLAAAPQFVIDFIGQEQTLNEILSKVDHKGLTDFASELASLQVITLTVNEDFISKDAYLGLLNEWAVKVNFAVTPMEHKFMSMELAQFISNNPGYFSADEESLLDAFIHQAPKLEVDQVHVFKADSTLNLWVVSKLIDPDDKLRIYEAMVDIYYGKLDVAYNLIVFSESEISCISIPDSALIIPIA